MQVNRSTFSEVMVPTYAPHDIVPVRGLGSRLWDQQGKDYIDFSCGIAVTQLGHSHPALISALSEQAQKLWHLSNVMANEPALRLARQLVQKTFAERVFFCNSGAEANEAALKLARLYGNAISNGSKNQIIAFNNAFHGRTLFTVSAGGQPKYSRGFEPLPTNIVHLPFNDLTQLELTISDKTCAVILEPVQGEGGVIPATREFLEAARRLCQRHKALLILDEVQTGLGRSGRLFAHEHFGVTPDVLTSAKGLGGGFPIGAMLCTSDVAQFFQVGTHGSTFGGNPLACSVASTVLEMVSDSHLLSAVERQAAALRLGLQAMARQYGIFEAPRGLGLLIGAPLSDTWKGRASSIVSKALAHGVWILPAGPDVLRFAPPLNISDEELGEGLSRLDHACAELTAAR